MNKPNLRSLSIVVIAAILMLAVLAAGCTQTTPAVTVTPTPVPSVTTRTITDMTGTSVTIPATVNRVADQWPAHNEVMVMLGAGDKLVATTTTVQALPWFKKLDPAIAKMPAPFVSSDVNIESLLNTTPDIVFVSQGSNATAAKIAQSGIPVVTLYFTTYDQLEKCFLLTGTILGDSELKKAQEYNAYLSSKLDMLNTTTSTIPASDKVSMLHIASMSPLEVDGNNTLINSWIQAAGGVNAAGNDVSGNMQTVSMEQILKWNPDVIIIGGTMKDKGTVMNSSQWQQLKAVQSGKVYVNPKGVFPWDRYGAEEALQIQWAAKTLYPDRFQSLDINNETKSFYKTYFGYDLNDSDVSSIMNPTA